MPRPKRWRTVLCLAFLLLSSCGGGSGEPAITVQGLPTVTVRADGSTTSQNVVGTKRISVKVEAIEPHTLLDDGEGVQVTYWFPESIEHTGTAELADEAGVFVFDLPDSEDLDICEKMLYRWSVLYNNADTGTRGTWLGRELFEMPTQEPGDGPGELETALCAD